MKAIGFSLMCTGVLAHDVEKSGKIERIPGVTEAGMADRERFASQYEQGVGIVSLPERFDSEEHWPQCAKVIGDIRDQSMCGCCWAFAAASAASDRLCISTNASIMVPISAQDVCFCSGIHSLVGGCNGGDITSPWMHMQFREWFGGEGAVTGGQYHGSGPFGSGLCLDFSMPHCHHHGPRRDDPYPAEGTAGCPKQKSPWCAKSCDSSAKAPHNDFENDKLGFKGSILKVSGEQDIMQAIMEGGPVETAFNVYSDFEDYTGGIYHHASGSRKGGHAVRMVGWGVENGQKYWKNSWNPYWGEKGYFRIRKGNNECGIENQVTASSADAQWGKKHDLFGTLVV